MKHNGVTVSVHNNELGITVICVQCVQNNDFV